MVISITLTYRVALSERARQKARLSGPYRDTSQFPNANALPNDFTNSLYSRWTIGNTQRSKRFRLRRRKDDFQRNRSRVAEITPLERGARGAPQTTAFFLLFYADIADRKGKLNSPTANAEISSFAFILQRGEREKEKRLRKRRRSLEFLHEKEARKRRRKKR